MLSMLDSLDLDDLANLSLPPSGEFNLELDVPGTPSDDLDGDLLFTPPGLIVYEESRRDGLGNGQDIDAMRWSPQLATETSSGAAFSAATTSAEPPDPAAASSSAPSGKKGAGKVQRKAEQNRCFPALPCMKDACRGDQRAFTCCKVPHTACVPRAMQIRGVVRCAALPTG